MKAFKILAFAAIVAFGLTACNNVEKILPKKDGRWDVTQVDSKIYFDGVLAVDTVLNDSLGFIVFNEDGTGYTEGEDGSKDADSDFTWTAEDDVIVIAEDSSSYSSDVLEISKKELVIKSVIEEDGGFFGTIRTESTSTLVRADK